MKHTMIRRRTDRLPPVLLLFIFPALAVYTAFLILPIVDSIGMSFSTGEGFIPDTFAGLENYRQLLFQSPFRERFWNAFFNNLKFFCMVTVVQNGCGFLLALAITRPLRGMKMFRTLSFLPTTLSVLVVGFLFTLILNPTWGAFDAILRGLGLEQLIRPWLGDRATALPVLSLVVSWQFLGESILFYSAGIDSISPEILESARIDGASFPQEVRHMIIPSVLPVIGIVTVLIFVGDFTQFDIVYAMTTTRGNPAYATDIFGSLFYRAAFQTRSRGGWGIGMGAAVSTMMSIIVFAGVLLWLYIFQRQRRKFFQEEA